MTAACFPNNTYEASLATTCFSNLLAIGFKRFIVDLYWDTSRLTWSLCPVELTPGGSSVTSTDSRDASTTSTTSSVPTSGSATLAYGALASSENDNERRLAAMASTMSSDDASVIPGVQRRGPNDSSSMTSSISMSQQTSPGTATLSNNAKTLYQVGPYVCDSSLSLENLTSVLAGYFGDTENSLNATMKYLIINLHSAAPYSDPTGTSPTPKGSMLPEPGNYVGELVNSSLSSYIYTPWALNHQRKNLNATWFTVSYDYQPLEAYLDLQEYDSGQLYTSDGWPSESFIELQRALRFLVGFGTIDSQMDNYNFTADADTIFPPGYLSHDVDVTLSSDGVISDGCLFRGNITSLFQINSSWALPSNLTSSYDAGTTFNTANNLSSCGISPILNATLGGPANVNMSLYDDYISAAVWAWAQNEPRDNSTTGQDTRCAALNRTNNGKWEVADCSDRHYAACRVDNKPYSWTISSQPGRYEQMDDACQSHTFSVPRTPLENRYLRDAIERWSTRYDEDGSSRMFWLNFNDVDTTGCWVTGVNQTCPYVERSRNTTRTVVVPTVAAVIVFVIAILTIFVKCGANRQNARSRRRRREGGWEYEGVPS